MQDNNTTQLAATTENAAVSKKATSEVAERFNTHLRMANAYSASTIVPITYQNNASNCFIAIEMAERMGANPFQVMQSLNIIQGRPSWSSQFIIAAINQSGRFRTQLNYKMEGSKEKGDLSCIAYATSNDGTLCESIKVTLQMAKEEGWSTKNGSKWKTMPELMIRYRAAAFFGRQYCPDLLLGLLSTEEQRDIIDAEFVETTPQNADYNNANPQEVKKEQETKTASKPITVEQPKVDVQTGVIEENGQVGFDFGMPER